MTIDEQINEQTRIIKAATKKLQQLFILREKERSIAEGQLTIDDLNE